MLSWKNLKSPLTASDCGATDLFMTIEKKNRKCLICNQAFGPMTDKQWEHAKHEHETLSLRHKKYLALRGS
jgi:hypothetical protein